MDWIASIVPCLLVQALDERQTPVWLGGGGGCCKTYGIVEMHGTGPLGVPGLPALGPAMWYKLSVTLYRVDGNEPHKMLVQLVNEGIDPTNHRADLSHPHIAGVRRRQFLEDRLAKLDEGCKTLVASNQSEGDLGAIFKNDVAGILLCFLGARVPSDGVFRCRHLVKESSLSQVGVRFGCVGLEDKEKKEWNRRA